MNPSEELKQVFTTHRGITKETNQFYGTTTGVDSEGNEVTRAYPYPHRTKLRVLPKDFSHNKGFRSNRLFGSDKFNAGTSKFLTIVEGEEDTMSAYQMLGSKYPVVGLPGAGISRDLLKDEYEYMNAFQQIIIATDSDDAGDKAAARLALQFPNRVYRVSMTTHKDPNEYLQNGKSSDFLFAWVNRTKYVPEWDVNTPDQFMSLLDESNDSKYLSTGIAEFDDIALGLMQGHLTVFTAPEGIGKTEFMRYLEYNLIKNHPDVAFAYCHLEESRQRAMLGLTSYHLKKNVTRKELIEDKEEVQKAIREMTERENVHQFSLGTDEHPSVLIDRIRYYANVCDCKYVFFEPIQDLAYQRNPEDGTEEKFLSKISVQLSRLASETGVGIVTIAHQNDDGEIRDCRLIGKQASVRIDLSRDTMATDEEIRNTTTLEVVKNRPVGPTGYAGQIIFDKDTFTLEEKVL